MKPFAVKRSVLWGNPYSPLHLDFEDCILTRYHEKKRRPAGAGRIFRIQRSQTWTIENTEENMKRLTLLFMVLAAGLFAQEAMETGLVDRCVDDPEAAALEYFIEQLAPHSASSLRLAVQAAREEYRQRVFAKLERVEDLYLSQLMETQDAVEGLNAFLEKRPAKWENR